MIKKGSAVTLIFITSTFVQLLSQIIITRIFGAKLDLEIFLAAVTIPTIIVTIIYGTLNDVLLPIYGRKKNKNIEEAESYFFSVLLILGFSSFIIAWILGFFTEQISFIFFSSRGETFVNNVSTQMFYMLFSVPLSVIATILGTYFYAHKNFSRFPLAQFVGSIINLVLIMLLAPLLGIWSLVLAFVINIMFQVLLVVPKTILKFKFTPVNIFPLLIAWLPLIIGTFALRSDTLLIRSFGSQLSSGSLVYLNLIAKIFSLATSVMTVGIQIILLPHLVDFFSNQKYREAIPYINKTKVIAIFISVTVTIMLLLLAPPIIKILFVGGKFTINDANATISLLPMFVLPAIGWGINGVFFQPLLALNKQIHLGIIHIIAFILAWGTAQLLSFYFGPLSAITGGLIILLFTGIIGSELLWQYYKRTLLKN